MDRKYPKLVVNMHHLRQNMDRVIGKCNALGIQVCGVIKGCSGLLPVARLFKECGASELASSRLEQIASCREAGIPGPYMLLRIPMLSELPDMVRWCDSSLHSDVTVLDALEDVCRKQDKTHRVIVMADLGDLREGFWNQDEMVDVCCHVERDLPHVHLAGVGVNLGCYGSIQPTPEKMEALLAIARRVESRIGRKLEVISGGATSSYTLVDWGTMPPGINHLRIGETILTAHDLPMEWKVPNLGLRQDAFVLQTEVVEIRTKPSYPVGKIMIDAFGQKPTYVDRGNRLRCIVGLGRADVGDVCQLIPRDEGITVLGGSSDHCILDVEDCPRRLQVGDIVEFLLAYPNMLYATARNDIALQYVDGDDPLVSQPLK